MPFLKYCYYRIMPFAPDIGLICLGHRTRMASRAVSRVFNSRMRPLNLQITQFALLVTLASRRDEPIAAMADRLDVEPSALLRNLKLLEARGLVAGAGGRGRRGRRLQLTPQGEELLEAAQPLWAGAHAELAQALGGQIAQTREILTQLESAALSLTSQSPPEA
jgi:DNA-binding MarR family transcriptional regulator